MKRQKINTTKIENMKKLRQLGYSVQRIAQLTQTNPTTVKDYTTPGFYEKRKAQTLKYMNNKILTTASGLTETYRDRVRRTTLGTVLPNGEHVVLRGLNKWKYSDKCEVCGKPGDTKIQNRLHYHHWLPNNPSLGIWICRECHWLAELLESKGNSGVLRLISAYTLVKISVIRENIEESVSSSKIAAMQ